MRPRLAASASSSGSNAVTFALSSALAGLKLAGTLRVCELVHTSRNGAAAPAGLAIVTVRVERVQRMVSCGDALWSAKVASLPSVN
jgi:hypothetical protein